MTTLTGKTIGELTLLSGITNNTLFVVEKDLVTYHTPFSTIVSGLSRNGTIIFLTGETITIQTNEQYLVYGDLTISGGSLTNYGQILILNGDLNIFDGDFNDFGETLFINTEGSILVTYNELISAIGTNNLVANKSYLIVDFQTIYDQPDFDSFGNPKTSVITKTSLTEPLLVKAISENEISNVVNSLVYPNDKIKYDWAWDETEIMGEPAKGRITERIDELGNRTDYDHRNILFKRYETSPGSGIYTEIDDNGNDYQEFKTFQTEIDNYSNTNFISDYAKLFNITTQPFLLSNNIFGEYSENNNLIGRFTNNTTGNGFKYNQSITEINKVDFTSATHVYGSYNCTLFENGDGDKALSFFGSGNVLTITNINT